ncbi:hypothetical protein AB9Q10_16415 [Streptomyces krungchingensis]|uniref:hypothetical protein n=1 Tax=Streptomyces krungchingensis TaxID=1565034 RepID=UPI003CF11247
MKITYVPMPREDVLAVLGPHWPAHPGARVARLGDVVAVTHGAVAVHEGDGPGTTWWAADGLIVPQGAGPAPQLPGCPMETLPEPAAASPPLDELAPVPNIP